MSSAVLTAVKSDRFVIGANVGLGKGRSVVDAPRTHFDPIEAALQEGHEAPFAKHDAAASLLCHGSNEPRQPQLLANPIPRRVSPDENGSAGEIAAVPFGKRARLVQLGGASAKLPSSLVKIKPKQLVGASVHLLGIAVGLGSLPRFRGHI